MSPELYQKLKSFGTVKTNVVLGKFTTFKIGGSADLLVKVTDREALVAVLNFLIGEGVEYIVLGGGSNMLLPDEGFTGVVVKVECQKSKVEDTVIEADAGVSFIALTMLAVQHNLTGLEWAAGLPGTVGGAVRGNAGAMGSDTGRSLAKVEVWMDGEVKEMTPADCAFGYRDSIFKHTGGVVLRAWFALSPGNAAVSLKQMQETIKRRAGHYPQFPSAGSFFKNVPLSEWQRPHSELLPQFVEKKQVPAGWLIEQAGLKGFLAGGAMVSREHGNFLINYKDATQADVLGVVEEVQTLVYNKFGVHLVPEVQIIH